MADACGARFVLGHRRALDPLAPSGLVGIDLDEACRAAEGPPIEAPADPERLAYVCFTSGTTGEPKAVGVPHRCAMRIVRGSRYADLSARDVFLHASPLAFDASVLEVWGALCNGATLALAPDGAFALEELAACIARHGVTVLWLTAPLFNEMVDRKAGALAGVSQLLVGGDRVSPAHVRRLIEGGYRGRLIDGYGPTETTVFATSHLVDGAHLERYAEDIPIGRALGDTSVVVLNARRGLAPCGVAGEIAIGGAGVARGYLNDAALTAERFRELRLAGLPDARFYLTGDLGLIGDDGELRYVGRRDRQVKVSGYRIELDAVEAALARAPGVTGCHCVADGGLVAYVARGPGPGAEQAIRDHARAHLPPYMVPSRFVFVDALPLNKNGKLDPSRLPRTDAGGEVAAPRAASLAPDLSELVRDVWRKELSNAAFGDDDNFFDIGGSSLKIMSVHEELCRALEPHGAAAKLEIMHLFEHTTVTALSSFLKGLVGDDDRG
jgi:amino acid adenylation domain-containing protein